MQIILKIIPRKNWTMLSYNQHRNRQVHTIIRAVIETSRTTVNTRKSLTKYIALKIYLIKNYYFTAHLSVPKTQTLIVSSENARWISKKLTNIRTRMNLKRSVWRKFKHIISSKKWCFAIINNENKIDTDRQRQHKMMRNLVIICKRWEMIEKIMMMMKEKPYKNE